MQYKTMVLGLLESHPKTHRRLQKARLLLPALDTYAKDLKARHESLMDQLQRESPQTDSTSITSAALEIALAELREELSLEESRDETDTDLLAGAMAFVRRHTPPV